MKLFFILDALKFSTVDNLQKQINHKTYVAQVRPPFSFEPDAAYLCGLYPQDSNAGMKIWKREVEKESKIFNALNLIDYESKRYRQIINKILRFFNIKDLQDFNGNIGCIPFNLLKYFELSEKNNLFQKNNDPKYQTIFNQINCPYSAKNE